MPGRLTPLVNDEYYHIFNRGNDKRNIFRQSRDYSRFQETIYYYQFPGPKQKLSDFSRQKLHLFTPPQDAKLIEVISYCLMPNHFHLLIRQQKDGGIAHFMSKLSNSYTKYFNTKYQRVGALFQGSFKSVLVKNDEQLMHLSRYIHLNPVVANLTKVPEAYPWSSYHEYLNEQSSLSSTKEVLALFSSRADFQSFHTDHIDYALSLDLLKHHLLD